MKNQRTVMIVEDEPKLARLIADYLAAANLATMIPAAPGYLGTFDAPLQGVMTLGAGLSPEAD